MPDTSKPPTPEDSKTDEKRADLGQPNHYDVQNIASGVRSLTIQNIGNLVLGFLLLGVLVRLLPANQFGIYSAVIAIYTISLSFSILGLQFAGARFVALLSRTDPEKSWLAARKILVLSLIFAFASNVVIAAVSPFLSEYFARTTAYSIDFILGAVYVFFATVSTVFQAFVQGLRKYNLLAKMLLTSRAAGLVLTVVGLLYTRSVEIPLAAWIGFNLIIVAWALKLFGKDIIRVKGIFEYSTILKYSIPLGLGSIVYAVANYADQIFVGGFLNTVDLAVYSAAVLVSTAIGGVLFLPLNTTFLPEASRLENERELSNGMRLAIRYGVLTVLPASMIQAGLSTQIISLFSGSRIYIAGVPSLQVISLLFVFVPLQGITTSLLQAVGETVKAMAVGLSMVVAVVILSIALIPPLGIEGAALSNALISIVGFLVGAYLTKRFLTLSKTYVFYAKVIIGSLAALAVTLALTIFVSSRILSLVPFAVIGLFVFLACVKGLKILTEEDKSYFLHVTPSALQWILKYL